MVYSRVYVDRLEAALPPLAWSSACGLTRLLEDGCPRLSRYLCAHRGNTQRKQTRKKHERRKSEEERREKENFFREEEIVVIRFFPPRWRFLFFRERKKEGGFWTMPAEVKQVSVDLHCRSPLVIFSFSHTLLVFLPSHTN